MRATAALLLGLVTLGGCLGGGEDDAPRPERGRAGDACSEGLRGRVSIPGRTGTLAIGGYANLLAVGANTLWVPVTKEAAPDRVRLVRVDLATGAVSRWPYRGTGEVRVRVGEGAVWLADPGPGTLTRLDPETGRSTVRRPLDEPRELTLGAGRVWLVPSEGGYVAELDPDSMRVMRRISVPGVEVVGDVAIEGRTLWLSAPEEGSVIRLDARSGRAVGEPIRVGGEPLDIEALDGDVWVDLGEADALAHIHGRSGRLLGRTPSGGDVFAIALGFGSVWATNYARDAVTRIDAATGRRVGRPIRTGPDPKGVVAGAGAVWVANAGACAVTRIDPGGTPVGFRTRDGVRLEGKVWGDGQVGIVFSHMGGAGDDQADWYPLARALAGRGYAALTYNRRGVCPGRGDGCSGGADDLRRSWQDVVAADRFLRSRGARSTVLVGASIGAMSSLRAAEQGHVDPVALVELAGVNHLSGYDFAKAEIARIGGAKLFISAADDAYGGDDAAREWHRWARGPKELEVLDGYAHGTELLEAGEPTARAVTRLIVRFIERHAPPR